MPEHTPAPTASRAVYGFALYIGFKLLFIVYLIWVYVPEEWLEYLGITCLPRRYWALAVPVFLLTVLTVFAFLIYPALGLCMTPDVDDLRTIVDSKSRGQHFDSYCSMNDKICSCKSRVKCQKFRFDSVKHTYPEKRVPFLHDLDIREVSQRLFLK